MVKSLIQRIKIVRSLINATYVLYLQMVKSLIHSRIIFTNGEIFDSFEKQSIHVANSVMLLTRRKESLSKIVKEAL